MAALNLHSSETIGSTIGSGPLKTSPKAHLNYRHCVYKTSHTTPLSHIKTLFIVTIIRTIPKTLFIDIVYIKHLILATLKLSFFHQRTLGRTFVPCRNLWKGKLKLKLLCSRSLPKKGRPSKNSQQPKSSNGRRGGLEIVFNQQ